MRILAVHIILFFVGLVLLSPTASADEDKKVTGQIVLAPALYQDFSYTDSEGNDVEQIATSRLFVC